MKIKLQYTQYMPRELKPGVLYVSMEFETAAHLCACGCGAKVRTPLGPTEWTFEETGDGPTLNPSIGNWQQKCKSHYWIQQGEIRWAKEWSQEMIDRGRPGEETRRSIYYENLYAQSGGMMNRFFRWFIGLWNR